MQAHNNSLQRWTVCAVAALVLALAACGGSYDSSIVLPGGSTTDCTQPTAQDTNGCTYVNMTDAPGDFLSYTVTVDSLQLKRQDGTTVELLPGATTIDFAQYVDLTEFLTLASMPPGNYVSGTLVLDYSNADIEVQDNSGNAVKVAPVDQNGNPLSGPVNLSISLDSKHSLLLVPGTPRLLQVDFDLDASNQVDLSTDKVTVAPFIVADVDPAVDKVQRVRGPLVSVSVANGNFTLGLHPFAAVSGNYGQLAVYTSNTTAFDINQQSSTGAAGLSALAAAGATTAVIAKGSFDFSSHHFIATEVYAGSSVPGGTQDVVQGVVTARSGNGLTLRGTTLLRTDKSVVFHDSVSVTVASTTKVREAGDPLGTFSIADLSVGQRLTVFGTLTDTNPAALALDASSGFARLESTRLDASVNSVSSTDLMLDLQSIEGRPVSLFNFAGTGTSGGADANPADYDVLLNGLGASFAANDPVQVFGLVTPFGSAPPDFNAVAVADFANADAGLGIGWGLQGTATPFQILDANNGISFDFSGVGSLHVLRRGGVTSDALSLSPAPTVSGTALGVFAIRQHGTVQVYISFADFVSDLTARLAAGGKVQAFFSSGGFDSSTDVMTANRVAVLMP